MTLTLILVAGKFPDGRLEPRQTLDGVPSSLLPAVLKALVTSLRPSSSVTLEFSALGPAMPSIFTSSLFLATSLALDSHAYARQRDARVGVAG